MLNPRYASANMALIAATSLAAHYDGYKAARHFRERHPNFDLRMLDYMWVDRSSSDDYLRLVRPMAQAVTRKLRHTDRRAV
jgi:hypothetical protein